MIDYWTQKTRNNKYKNVCGTEVEISTIVTINGKSEACITKPSQLHTNGEIVEWLVWVNDKIVAECISKKVAAEVALHYIKKFNENK